MIDLKGLVRSIPDHPKPGILFRDVTTLLANGPAFRELIDQIVIRYRPFRIDQVAGIEARGFILGGAVAHGLGAGFVPIRKQGKLPAATVGQDYDLEYGSDRVEIHRDAIAPGHRVLLIDDLIATGGTAMAALALLTQLESQVVEACFAIDLPDLGGRRRLEAAGYRTFSVMEFDGH